MTLLPTIVAAVSGAVILLAPVSTENAVANGDTRTIHLHHAHTQESIDATFLVDGRYDPAVLEKLNWFLRDWRREEPTHMDPKLFDTIWEVYRESGSQQPIVVMSAYRSPETNAMLRRASRSVAEHSQHILGKAMDQHYQDVPMSKIREIAMRLQRGGVGFYPTAGTPFVHMDVGGVRHWPRMSYDQLSRLFPDGKTVHIPSNGTPLPGYEQARAELEARGDAFDYPTVTEVKSKGFFAWLFGGGDDDADGTEARETGTRRAPLPGRQQVASAGPVPLGSTSSDGPMSSSGKDAGVHLFSFVDSPARSAVEPAAPAPAAGGTRGRKARALVASLPSAAPIDPVAQQQLAAEMQRREQERAQAAAAQAQDAAEAEAAAQAAAQDRDAARARAAAQAETAAQGEAGVQPSPPDASSAPVMPAARVAPVAIARLDVPLPPRRPFEFASEGPLPPRRVADGAGVPNDHAAVPGAPRAVVASLPSTRPGLPAAITQGGGLPPLPPRVMAFATPSAASQPASVPLPLARPQFVAARLDRSNFRSLTGTTPTDRVAARSGMGSAVSALRPAAQANLGTLASASLSGQARGFGSRATDLSTDRFSGPSVTSLETINTATLRKRTPAPTAD